MIDGSSATASTKLPLLSKRKDSGMIGGRRVVVLGFGAVGQCTVPLLIRDRGFAPSQITVLEFEDNRHRLGDLIDSGIVYETIRIDQHNLDEELSKRLAHGDVLLDLAWNIDACTIIQWCHDRGVHYLNTSVEEWDPFDNCDVVDPRDRTLYVRHMRIREMMKSWREPGASGVVEHGANPGLVSHFAKQALWEIANRMLGDGLGDRSGLENALSADDFAALCRLTGTKVIHISERDTQVSITPKKPNEFVNSWSIEGLYEEGVAPAEIGWGTHEEHLPVDAYLHEGDGPRNQICLARAGIQTRVRSWVPNGGPIIGMVIRHGEAFTMSEHLSSFDDSGRLLHRPTVHYAYCPTDAAIASIHELLGRQWTVQDERRVMNDDITHGEDELGVLLMGHPYGAWWTGTQLSIDEARRHVKGQNATTLQVASSIMGAIDWMLSDPERGLCVPDQLPWRQVLAVARPYLGNVHSGPSDWNPIGHRRDVFAQWRTTPHGSDPSDPWQFGNFLLD
ncbi:MAG: saccharopine dehydrogenase C-terminal domain-containing protein [Ilumatobacteraceae bacterium]